MVCRRMTERERRMAKNICETASIANGAVVVGDVTVGDYTSILFNAVLRGDDASIRIGRCSNIQDNATVHTDRGRPTVIGNHVTVGHNAVVHGCTVGDGSLIGMGAVVLNGAKIGKHCLIGAGSLVLEGQEIPDGSLAVGNPAKIKRMLTEKEIQKIYENSIVYVETGKRLKRDGYARNV